MPLWLFYKSLEILGHNKGTRIVEKVSVARLNDGKKRQMDSVNYSYVVWIANKST